MDSINGPGITPPTLPSIQPTRSTETEAQPSAQDVSLPYAPSGSDADASRASDSDTPPAGVDPELWSVLTAEEREFFSVAHELGPVTYGRATERSGDAAIPRGRRLDVRV